MIFHVSDAGVFKSGLFVDVSSPSPNLSKNRKLSASETITVSGESAVQEASRSILSGNSPAYLVSISGEGKAALNTMKSLSQGMNNIVNNADKNTVTTNLIAGGPETNSAGNSIMSGTLNQTPVKNNNLQTETVMNNVTAEQKKVSEEPVLEETSKSVNTNNLSRFTEYQLKQMVNDGSITRTDMNDELEKRTKSE